MFLFFRHIDTTTPAGDFDPVSADTVNPYSTTIEVQGLEREMEGPMNYPGAFSSSQGYCVATISFSNSRYQPPQPISLAQQQAGKRRQPTTDYRAL
jgi:hypothetical protein